MFGTNMPLSLYVSLSPCFVCVTLVWCIPCDVLTVLLTWMPRPKSLHLYTDGQELQKLQGIRWRVRRSRHHRQEPLNRSQT